MKKTASSSLLRAHSRGSFSRLVFESETNNGGGHKDRSLSYRFCQLVVMLMRLVTPASYIFIITLTAMQVPPTSFGGNIPFAILTIWMIVEALFFPYYYYLFRLLNKSKSELEHFASNKRTRMRLVKNCFQALRLAANDLTPELYIRKALEGWFLEVPIGQIKRGNMESWCGWAFLGYDIEHMSVELKRENIEIVEYIEKQAGWRFPPGFQEDLPSARLTLDPVFATQRPFFIYGTIWGVNTLTHMVLWAQGFRKRHDCSTDAQIIYHRKGTDSRATPLFFVHGIGIGFGHYLAFISMLPREIDVYLVEWPHVAMQLGSSVPSIDQSVKSVLAVLDSDGHAQACFSAHSLGSTLISWMLHHPEGCKRVSSTILVDPVTFLLCDPMVATNVVYKEPRNTIDFLMHFFVARELFIANALSRHFNWSHNILFVEDLSAVDPNDRNAYSPTKGSATSTSTNENNKNHHPSIDNDNASVDSNENVSSLPVRHTIVLSSGDSIVPVDAVLRYLQAKVTQGHTCFEVLTFKGTHGEVYLYPRWVMLLVNKCRGHCGLLELDGK